jgi:hypothetical protein
MGLRFPQVSLWHSRSRGPRGLVVLALAGAALLGVAGLAGCTPQIGDSCVLSTDCSTQGTLVCDPAEPGGYCTQVNCQANLCPNEAACVLFNANLPGCGYNDRVGPMGPRSAEAFCMKQCHKNSDCRSGYICTDPRQPPWDGQILDDDQTQHICIGPPDTTLGDASDLMSDALVCQASGPDVGGIDAPVTYSADTGEVDAGAADTGAPDTGTADSGVEAGADAGAGDAGATDGGAHDAADAGG